MAAHQASPSLGFSRQEHWSGLPFPSPMHECEVAQSCPTVHNPVDCTLPGSALHGIFQARVLEWVAIAFSGNCVHGTGNPWTSKSRDPTVTGEAGGRPQRCMLSGYLEKCSEPRASGHFRAASLGSQVAHCLWLIASLNNHTVPCWGLCFSWVYPLLSTDSPRASAFKSINAPKVVFFFLFFSLFVLFIYL